MIDISLKQLRYFDAVARLGHFARAADDCCISQPALSMQIQNLEQTLGLQLIERRRDGAKLTDAGRDVAEKARHILLAMQDLGDVAHNHGHLLTGSLGFGVIPTLAPYVLPRLLPRLAAEYGLLDLHIRETHTHALIDQLITGQLDVVLLALPVEHTDIETSFLFEDPFLFIQHANADPMHLVHQDSDVLRASRLLLLEEGHCLRDQALSLCRPHQAGNVETFGASSLSTLVQLVANGLGVSLLPEISVPVETQRGDVRVVRFADPQPSRSIGLAWRASSQRKRDFLELGHMIVQCRDANIEVQALAGVTQSKRRGRAKT
ncbi:MAG: hydrogen peroxide-inducible genes activator [Pseudomonadota bacterium]